MSIEHGHTDWAGLMADRASGIPLNKLKFEKCHVCKSPRNEYVGLPRINKKRS